MKRLLGILMIVVMLSVAASVFGGDQSVQSGQEITVESKIDTGDTAWILVSTALALPTTACIFPQQ